MRLGIIGLPQSGKTTVFNALTRGNRPVMMGGGRFEVHTAVVDVPDYRVDELSKLFNPKKTTYAKTTYADIAGMDGSAGKEGFSGPLLNQLSQMDGFLNIVRCFEDENLPHPAGSVDPVRDVATIDGELLINDLIQVERKLERLAAEHNRGGRDKAAVEQEQVLFERLHVVLSEETPLRKIDLTPDERKSISGFGFLTLKPIFTVFNLDETQETSDFNVPQHNGVAGLKGKLEMDLAQLSPEDANMFMEEYGIEELGLSRMIWLSYDMLGLQSFFTVGEDEVRAWTVRRGALAPEAAGVIHSDLQKGFIRAEVISYLDLVTLGGLSQARAQGKLRLEGKEYVVADGDVMNIRFNI